MSGSIVSVVSNAQITIKATSPVTQSVIAAVFAAAGGTGDIVTYNGSITPSATTPGATLYVLPNTTGNLVIPTGFSYVMFDQTSSVTATGGDQTATVVGDSFNYSGSATLVVSGAGVANITDGANGATIDIGSANTVTAIGSGGQQLIQLGAGAVGMVSSTGNASTVLAGANSTVSILATGAGDTIDIGNGTAATVTLTGGDTINIGFGAQAANGASKAQSAPLAISSVTGINASGGSFNTFNVAANQPGFASANLILALGTSDTVNVMGGTSSVFALASDVVNNNAGNVEFIGSPSSSTVVGGTGQTTVFGGAGGQVFDVGTAFGSNNQNLFVGGSAASTINAGTGGGIFFGGTHGDLYNIGSSSAQTFLGLGGNDTLGGTAGAVAPTVFAINGEHLALAGSAPNLTVVALTTDGSIDNSRSHGNNVFFTGFGATGNETLTGSSGGGYDTFEVGSATLSGAAVGSGPQANITIDNWHSGDVFYLIGFGAADNATMDAAATASAQPGAPSTLSFTLSDHTTVSFVGSHPSGINAGAHAIY